MAGSITMNQKDSGFWVGLRERLGRDIDYEVAVGIPRGGKTVGTRYKNGTPVLEVAFYNEFGTETIPSRPAIRTGGKKAGAQLKEAYRLLVKRTNREDKLLKGLNLIGLKAAAIVKREITEWKDPPNAPATIARKHGVDNPLVDTGLYRKCIIHAVRKRVRRK